MGHLPLCIDAVTVKTTPDLIIDAAGGHRAQHRNTLIDGPLVPPQSPFPDQILKQPRRRKSWRIPEPCWIRRVTVRGSRETTIQICLRLDSLEDPCRSFFETLGQADCVVDDLLPLLTPDPIDGTQYVHETWSVETSPRREIGSTVKWGQIRHQEHGEGPTSSVCHRPHCIHVDIIDVRKIFTVNFYRDEVLVEESGDLLVGKRLSPHHMAPVTRRISDGEKDGTIESLSLIECILTPGIPLDGIFSMFAQIGAGTLRQSPAPMLRIRVWFVSG